MIKTCATLNYSETCLATVSLTEYRTALPSPWLAGHLYLGGFFWHLVVLHSCWAYLLSTWGRSLVRAFTGSACEACFAAMKISIRTCMPWYFIMFFAFGIELSNFHQNLVRALHCHGNWGFTSLSTLMIYRLLVVFLYLFLNILCGYLVVCLFKFGLVFLKWWSYFECYKCIKALKCMRFIFSPNPSNDAIVNNSVYSA